MGGAHHNSTVLYGSAPQFYVVLYYFTPQFHSFIYHNPTSHTVIYFYNICYKIFTP